MQCLASWRWRSRRSTSSPPAPNRISSTDFRSAQTILVPTHRRVLGLRACALLTSEFVRWHRSEQAGGLRVAGRHRDCGTAIAVDRMIVATGFRPDFSFLREVRLLMDPVLGAPVGLARSIDPLLHSCCTVAPHGEAILRHPDHGLYIAGMKSYGRTPNFLLPMGYEQVRSIAAELAGDHVAAQEQRLSVAASSSCSCNPLDSSGGSCCGTDAVPIAGHRSPHRAFRQSVDAKLMVPRIVNNQKTCRTLVLARHRCQRCVTLRSRQSGGAASGGWG
jgi:hypothetical protein